MDIIPSQSDAVSNIECCDDIDPGRTDESFDIGSHVGSIAITTIVCVCGI